MKRTIAALLTLFVFGMLTACGGGDSGGAGGTNKVVTMFGIPFKGVVEGPLTTARLSKPCGGVFIGTNLYATDENTHTIVKVDTVTGVATILAGGKRGFADGNGIHAEFNVPLGITTDGTFLYVADHYNDSIRRIDPATGEVTTLAGTGGSTGYIDGGAVTAQFYRPYGITTDGTALYVTDSENNAIRKVAIADGTTTTLAGGDNYLSTNGFQDGSGGAAGAARFKRPYGITTDGAALYVADVLNNAIRKVDIVTGDTLTLAGGVYASGNSPMAGYAWASGFVDGAGWTQPADNATPPSGNVAQFSWPYGITTYGTALYVMDRNNSAIRKVDIATGATTTLAGGDNYVGTAGYADGSGGAAGTARFNYAMGITTDGAALYVFDRDNSAIRQVSFTNGNTTTLLGGPYPTAENDGSGWSSQGGYWLPGTAVFDPVNWPLAGITHIGSKLYVVDSCAIKEIDTVAKQVTTIVGTNATCGFVDGAGLGGASTAQFNFAVGITTDDTFLYVADSGNNAVRKIDPATGTVTTLAGGANYAGTAGFVDGSGGAAGTARFYDLSGIAMLGTSLYVTDSRNNAIRQVNSTTGATTTLAGGNNYAGTNGFVDGSGGAAGTARFNRPYGIASHGTALFIADQANLAIRRVDSTTGATTTLAGGAPGFVDGTGGAAGTARFSRPWGLTTDGTNLYVTDLPNNAIRAIAIADGATTTLVGGTVSGGVNQASEGSMDGTLWHYPGGVATPGTAVFQGPYMIHFAAGSLWVTDGDDLTLRKIYF